MSTPVDERDQHGYRPTGMAGRPSGAPPAAATPAPPPSSKPPADGDKPRRINVAVTPDAVAGLEHVIAREGVTLTEAARRLLSYGYFVYCATKVEGGSLELRLPDGTTKNVIFV